MDNLIIRPETENDHEAVYNLIKTAFETAKVADGDEQDYMEDLRKEDSYINDLSLVAEIDGKIIGQNVLFKTYIESGKGNVDTLLLGPICVAIEYRDKGIGSALIKESFRIAKEKGFQSVFLCGDPLYYSRFGFIKAADLDIRIRKDIPEQFVLAYELVEGSLKDVSGYLHINF